MNLDGEGNVWCHYCLAWHNIRTETLWIPKENCEEIDIVCEKVYPEKYIHLGYDKDIGL